MRGLCWQVASIFINFAAMSTMQVIGFDHFGGPEVLEMMSHPRPQPGPNEVLVRVAATALNRADLLQRQGKYPPPPGESPILGLEMAGEVVATGTGCQRWKIGDQLCGLLAGGGYAQYAVIHEDLALPVPAGWSHTEAAAMPEVFMTAYQALVLLARLQPGEKVLIHAGGSGVGTAALQLVKQLGGESYVTASAPKHQLCRDLGAKWAYDYHQGPFAEPLLEATSGEGIDVVLDFVAAPYFEQHLKVLRTDGRLVLLALMGGAKVKESLNLAHFLRKRLSLLGTTLRARSLSYKIELAQAMWRDCSQAFESQAMKPVIDSVYSWREAAAAHAHMASNQNVGKIVLEVD
jgi:tumor protein p53-inducible protein 3